MIPDVAGGMRGGERRSRSQAAKNIPHPAMTRGEDPDALFMPSVDERRSFEIHRRHRPRDAPSPLKDRALHP